MKMAKENWYIKKLKDPKWQKKRLEILNRDGFKCLFCGDSESSLHVHHKSYIYKKDPWDYQNNNFLTLCQSCHELEEITLSDMQDDLVNLFRSLGFTGQDIVDIGAAAINGHLNKYKRRVFKNDK